MSVLGTQYHGWGTSPVLALPSSCNRLEVAETKVAGPGDLQSPQERPPGKEDNGGWQPRRNAGDRRRFLGRKESRNEGRKE